MQQAKLRNFLGEAKERALTRYTNPSDASTIALIRSIGVVGVVKSTFHTKEIFVRSKEMHTCYRAYVELFVYTVRKVPIRKINRQLSKFKAIASYTYDIDITWTW